MRRILEINSEKNLIDENLKTNKTIKIKLDTLDEAIIISSTKKTKIIFEFLYYPEYLNEGTHLIINDDLLKAYGIITKLYK